MMPFVRVIYCPILAVGRGASENEENFFRRVYLNASIALRCAVRGDVELRFCVFMS